MVYALLIGGPHGGRWTISSGYRDLLTPPPITYTAIILEETDLYAPPDPPIRYVPRRFYGGGWSVAIWLWVWDGYRRKPDGTPDVPRSHLPAWAQPALESSYLCEACYRQPMPGVPMCFLCWMGDDPL